VEHKTVKELEMKKRTKLEWAKEIGEGVLVFIVAWIYLSYLNTV